MLIVTAINRGTFNGVNHRMLYLARVDQHPSTPPRSPRYYTADLKTAPGTLTLPTARPHIEWKQQHDKRKQVALGEEASWTNEAPS